MTTTPPLPPLPAVSQFVARICRVVRSNPADDSITEALQAYATEYGRLCRESAPASPSLEVEAIAELRALYLAYVNLLDAGRDRIKELGGYCDPPALIAARRFLATAQVDDNAVDSIKQPNEITGSVSAEVDEPEGCKAAADMSVEEIAEALIHHGVVEENWDNYPSIDSAECAEFYKRQKDERESLLNALSEKFAEAQKDAARWRWICVDGCLSPYWGEVHDALQLLDDKDDIDQAIDAAMAARRDD